MKKTKIYAWMVFGLGLALTACSNLDESAFHATPTEESIICSETFASSLGQFTSVSVKGDQKWEFYSSGYAIMTGYVNSVNNENEDWLISPKIDLTNVSAAHFTFDHAPRYFSDVTANASVWVSENYNNDSLPAASTWTQIKTNPFSDPGSWTFGPSGEISLTEFAGKKITIAFKYTSTSVKAGTWEIKNFLVKKGEAVVDKALIYSEGFASGLGLFTTQNVSGDLTWVGNSNGYAYMTGYANATNYANEDWLISPQIDLTTQTAAHFQFDHVARYFGNLATEATVWISSDYVSGLPSTATWTQITTSPFSDPGAWTFGNSQEISLTAYTGKKVFIAFKFTSTATKAGSWEIKNFQVFSSEANGIEADPYTVATAIGSQKGATSWVEGYVVGYAWPFQAQYAYFFTPDSCTQMMNVLIADTTTNLYISKCLAVQLPRGNVRNVLNLKTNKSILGQKVKLYGTLTSNMGIAGLVNPKKYVLADGTSGISSTTNFYQETFASNLGLFTTNNISGAQVWSFASGFGAKMSGYTSVNNANEDWLISKELDFTSQQSVALSFDHTINKGVVANMKSEQTLWVTTDNGATWKQLSIPTYPAGNNWTYVNSGEISLDAYAGMKIKIAFKYTCTNSSSATWEIKNLVVYY